MERYQEVNNNISKLESLTNTSGRKDFREIWNQIKETGASFKGVRFPSKEEHENAWDRFQEIVEEVKQGQEENRRNFEQRRNESARIRDRILRNADDVNYESSGLAELIAGIATCGVSLVLEHIMGPFDRRKEELQKSSSKMKRCWEELQENKEKMIGEDKKVVFEALKEASQILDKRWDSYKEEREKAYSEYKQGKEEKYQNWKQKIEQNIVNLQNKRDSLQSVLSQKESNLEDLHDKLDNAWSDDFRSNVYDWISDTEASIEEIQGKLENIEGWIRESQDKLYN